MMKDIGGKRKTVAFFSLEMSAEQVASDFCVLNRTSLFRQLWTVT